MREFSALPGAAFPSQGSAACFCNDMSSVGSGRRSNDERAASGEGASLALVYSAAPSSRQPAKSSVARLFLLGPGSQTALIDPSRLYGQQDSDRGFVSGLLKITSLFGLGGTEI